jgi:8-oxo-dGTP diphosphatase
MGTGRDSRDATTFPVAVELVVLTVRDGTLEVLLRPRTGPPFAGCPALPGTSVSSKEGLDEAASRVFAAATGLPVPHMEQLGTYGDPERDPRRRVISVAYLALLPLDAEPAPPGAAPASSFMATAAEARGLAFDHDRIVADAVDRMRSKLEYTTLGATLLPDEFTLGDLRRVYESVWGVTLHHSNFTRKVRSVDGFVEPTGRRAPTSGAPALFRQGPASVMKPALMRS